jgi:hypothetical protein
MYSAGESEGSTPGIDEEDEDSLGLVVEGGRGVPPPIIEIQGVPSAPVPGWISFTR